jgi:hypothetical protein
MVRQSAGLDADTKHGGSFWKKANTQRRFNRRRTTTWPAASTP